MVEVVGASLAVLDVESYVVLDMEGFGGEFVPDMEKIAA